MLRTDKGQTMNAPRDASAGDDDEVKRRKAKHARLVRAIPPGGSGSGGSHRKSAPVADFPLQQCDFEKWRRYDSLPIEQACFVLFGFEPPPLHVLRFEQDMLDPSRKPTWDEPPKYGDALRSLRVSIEHGKVPFLRITEYPYVTRHVTWSELVRWARAKTYAIPSELEAIAALDLIPVPQFTTVPPAVSADEIDEEGMRIDAQLQAAATNTTEASAAAAGGATAQEPEAHRRLTLLRNTEPVAFQSAPGAFEPAKATSWRLVRPKRFQGYGKPLYDLLKVAHASGHSRPTARSVLDAWKPQPPPEVTEVMHDGLKYLNSRGNTNPANLAAITEAIRRMTA